MADLLTLALHAKIPIIKVRTNDPLHAREILSFIAEEAVVELVEEERTPSGGKVLRHAITLESTEGEFTYCMAYDISGSEVELYTYLQEAERTVILVNNDSDSDLIFDAGILPTPPKMVFRLLKSLKIHKAEAMMGTLGGLTLKEVDEVIRMCMAANGSVTAGGISGVRRLLVSRLKGISQVDTELPFYVPEEGLAEWLALNGPLFLKCEEPRLVPRGLMFEGLRGAGKTQGAKYIAQGLGVPLYLLSLSNMLTKWVGESESNLRRALDQADQESPCVLLIDEVEKIYSGGQEDSVADRLLAYLLWWLQEHTSRVLTVMTTNDIKKLPPEMYRPGRIDKVLSFRGLDIDAALEFVEAVVKSFDHLPQVKKNRTKIVAYVCKGVNERCTDPLEFHMAQSDITQMVIEAVKPYLT